MTQLTAQSRAVDCRNRIAHHRSLHWGRRISGRISDICRWQPPANGTVATTSNALLRIQGGKDVLSPYIFSTYRLNEP
ncbi:MAG: hypothetical protein R3C26_14685 [Calditrichia bacterium]